MGLPSETAHAAACAPRPTPTAAAPDETNRSQPGGSNRGSDIEGYGKPVEMREAGDAIGTAADRPQVWSATAAESLPSPAATPDIRYLGVG